MNYKVLTSNKSVNASGKDQISGQLEDQTGNIIPYLVWQEKIKNVLPNLRKNNYIQLDSISDYRGTIVLNEISVIKEARLGLTMEESEQTVLGIIANLDIHVVDEDYKPIKDRIVRLLNNPKLYIAPAAMNHHHNYIGGLLVHIEEVIYFSSKLIEGIYESTKKPVNISLVFLGAVMHDLGKISEYKIDPESGLIEYNKEWAYQWVSHTQWAFTYCMSNKWNELAQLVASHHNLKEWGALKEPDSIEAWVLHLADMSSSRLGKISADMLPDLKPIPINKPDEQQLLDLGAA